FTYQCSTIPRLYRLFSSTPPATSCSAPLSLHDALPISLGADGLLRRRRDGAVALCRGRPRCAPRAAVRGRPAQRPRTAARGAHRSEEHTSELQSQSNIVCPLLLEKKKM